MQPSESIKVTAHIKAEGAQVSENTPQLSARDDPASVKDLTSRARQATFQEPEAHTPISQSAESPHDGADGPDLNGSVTVEDHSTDSSMELVIGSNFECKAHISVKGLVEVDMDARAIFKSSVVHLMEGIQSASSKVINKMRSRTTLSVRVKAVSNNAARLWAVLDMKELSDSERKQMRDFAAGVTSEMYAPTEPQKFAEFQSRVMSIEQTYAGDAGAASPEATETAKNAKRHALDKAALEYLPSHMQRVVSSCSSEADTQVVLEAVQRVVEKGRVLCAELSKSKELEGLELHLGEECLLRKDDRPQVKEVPQKPDVLPVQEAQLTKIDLVKCIVSLHLSRDDCRADVDYNDQEQGDAIGEWLIAAILAKRKPAKPDGEGMQPLRRRVGLTRRTDAAGRKTYALDSIESI